MTESAQASRNRRLIARLTEIFNTSDWSSLHEVMTDDFIQDIPQSRERLLGLENFRSSVENYPGTGERPIEMAPIRILGEDPRYVMTPTFSLVRVEGTGTARSTY